MRNVRVLRAAPRGFTLMEVMIVSALLAMVGVLLAEAWKGLGRPLVDVATSCRLAREANAAVASLSRDLGGSLANNEGRLGGKTTGRVVGRMQPGNSQLWLCFDGGPNPNGLADWGAPDTVISYQLIGNALVRWDQNAATTFTVASDMDSLEVQDLDGQAQITLTFRYRNVTQSYTLMAKDP